MVYEERSRAIKFGEVIPKTFIIAFLLIFVDYFCFANYLSTNYKCVQYSLC